MSALNQFKKIKTASHSFPEKADRSVALDPNTTELTTQYRTRRLGTETYTYIGGSKNAAEAMVKELEATSGMGEVDSYANDPRDEYSEWTVTAQIETTGAWSEWA